jgi:hypothetical protein
MWTKSRVRSYLTLVSSSMRMPQWTHCAWPKHYPIIHPWSEVRYHPTRRHMKLLSLGTPYIPYVPVHNQMLAHLHPIDVDLNCHRRGLPPWSSEFMIQTTPNLPIEYSPFSPNYPARSPIMPTFSIILLNPHRTSIYRKGPIASGIQPLVLKR